ncbi:hypothetical protein FQN54_003879 [Arachnomyces sp. PD_36]|nr:hypothetical protein FQN54_003879 [Arachnomyces sp. PD_36]
MEIQDNHPRPGALVERFSWEMENRGRSDSDTDEFNQLRLDLIEQTKRKRRARDIEIRRIEEHFSETRSDDESVFDKTRQELLQSMKKFQALVPEEFRSTTVVPRSWSDVERAVSAVQSKWDSKPKDSQVSRTKQWLRKMCNGMNDHSAALNMLPKDSEYVSLVGGAVIMIIKASANYTSITEAFVRGIVDINDAVAIVQKNQIYNTEPIQQLTMRLYSRIFSYLTKFMTWYTDRSRTRFLKSFNENVQQIFDEDLKQIEKISLLLSQQLQLYTSADVRVSKLLAEDTNWTVKYLVKLVENEKTQRKLQEEATARLIQTMFLGQFKKSTEEIEKSSKKMMAEYNERVRQEISGAAVTSLLEHRISQEFLGTGKTFGIRSLSASPIPCRSPRRGEDDNDSSDGSEEVSLQSADINFNSRNLEEYISWDHVFPFPETPRQLCADTAFITRLDSFTTSMESQILYAHAQYRPEGLNLLRLSAAKFISLAREHKIPVVSYFCRLSAPAQSHEEPIPETHTPEPTELISLLYSMIRQTIGLLPVEEAATSPLLATVFSEARFSSLDGTLNTWDTAVELLCDLIASVRLPLLLFVIDGLNLLEDDSENSTSDRIETLARSLKDLTQSCMMTGPKVKLLFTTAGLSSTLCRELDDAQVVTCNTSSLSRETGSPRSRRHYFVR